MQPLLRTHPEFEIINQLPAFIEYRVYNYKLRKDGTNLLRFGYGYSYADVVAIIGFYLLWIRFQSSWATGLGVIVFIYTKVTQLLCESIIVLPNLGIQVQSTRGISIPFSKQTWWLSTSKTFIPLDEMHDVLINEGPLHWDWYYYLAIVRRTPPRPFKNADSPSNLTIAVAFEQTLPALDVVREIYHGVQDTLFDDYADDITIARNLQEIENEGSRTVRGNNLGD